MRQILRTLKLAEYGGDELIIATVACAALGYLLSMIDPRLAVLPLAPWLIVVWFFRDPHRTGPADAELMLSPADGRVSDIEELEEPHFIRGRAVRIGIFLSPLNVHVNRTPTDGVVQFVKYTAGEFLPAYNPKAPERNECVALGMETPGGLRLMVRQITGVLARRIICEAQLGETLQRGQRYGMIKFGSRTELYIPIDMMDKIEVKIGDTVTGGTTVLCKVRMPAKKEVDMQWNVSGSPPEVAAASSVTPASA